MTSLPLVGARVRIQFSWASHLNGKTAEVILPLSQDIVRTQIKGSLDTHDIHVCWLELCQSGLQRMVKLT